jgi:hypothetical protein
MEESELVQVLVSRKKVDELYQEKLGRDPVGGVIAGQRQMVRASILSAKALLSVMPLEEAKELISKVVFDFNELLGKERAAELGNPTDLDSYLKEYVFGIMDAILPVPPIEILERSEKRCHWGVRACQYRDAIMFWKEKYPDYVTDDVVEWLKARCTHDHGWTIGFNPKIKYERTHFMLDGDDGCFFMTEIE